MKFGVITFPGSNCDHDLLYVLGHIMGQQVVHLWHKDQDLQGADVLLLPGGFSYGDYLRTGAIARFSPIMREVAAHAQRGGYVIGICNGFQILCEAGLLPGVLLRNAGTRFICDYTYLRPANHHNALNKTLADRSYKTPFAHGDGNYFAAPAVLQALEDNQQVVYRYCDAAGSVTPEANPNGSVNNIAGICNRQGNVFGFMPHPERAADPLLGQADGRLLLDAFLNLN